MRIPLLLLSALTLGGCAATAPYTAVTTTPSTANTAESKVSFAKSGSGEVRNIPRDALLGTWYGRQPTVEGTIKEWITTRASNGDFMVRFRTSRAGKVIEQSAEVGEWGLSYDMEVVITRGWLDDGVVRPASPDAYFWDIYRLNEVTADTISYTTEGGDRNHYVVKRVPQDFEFPALTAQ